MRRSLPPLFRRLLLCLLVAGAAAALGTDARAAGNLHAGDHRDLARDAPSVALASLAEPSITHDHKGASKDLHTRGEAVCCASACAPTLAGELPYDYAATPAFDFRRVDAEFVLGGEFEPPLRPPESSH